MRSNAFSLVRDGVSQTWREIKRSKFTYCIGCTSVFLVVVLAAAVQTLVSRAPLIFLREAEAGAGQADFRLTAADGAVGQFLNYTRLAETLALGPTSQENSYHAPRVQLSVVLYSAARCSPGVADGGADRASTSANSWMYRDTHGSSCGSPYTTAGAVSCLPSLCSGRSESATLVLADSRLESRMGYGREWPYKTGLPPRSIVMHSQLAKALQVKEGQTVIARVEYSSFLTQALSPPNASMNGWLDRAWEYPDVALPFTVAQVTGAWSGKLPGGAKAYAIAELGPFLQHAASMVHPRLRPHLDGLAEIEAHRLAKGLPSQSAEYATEVSFNLPATQRIAAYSNSNFDTIRTIVAGFASRLLYIGGFTETDPELVILTALQPRRFITLFMDILLSSLLLILFALSTVLIYSLLLINVAERQFELAVRRMLGSGRPALVVLLLVQALAYALPAWVIGLAVAQILSSTVLAGFTSLSGIDVDKKLTPTSVGIATGLALVIPILAAIGPIRTALGPSVREALDNNRPKAAAVKFTVERADPGKISWPVVVTGGGAAVFGFGLYFVLPLSLISSNLSLLLNLFIVLILALLAGLTVLALNLELITSRLALRLFGWWDAAVVQQLARANLTAHRLRNRKTVLMYALSIAFIVFISVAAEQQVLGAVYFVQQDEGAPLVVRGPEAAPDPLILSAVEAVARKWTGEQPLFNTSGAALTSSRWAPPRLSDQSRYVSASSGGSGSSGGSSQAAPVLATAWSTAWLDSYIRATQHDVASSQAQLGCDAAGRYTGVTSGASVPAISEMAQFNKARLYSASMRLRACSPGMYDGATYPQYTIPGDGPAPEETSLSPTAMLYTTRGGQGALFSSGMKAELGFWRDREAVIQSRQPASSTSVDASVPTAAGGSGGTLVMRTLARVMAMMDGGSFFVFARNTVINGNYVVTGLPAVVRMADHHMGIDGVPRADPGLLHGIWAVQHAQATMALHGAGQVPNVTSDGVALAGQLAQPAPSSSRSALLQSVLLEQLLAPGVSLPWSGAGVGSGANLTSSSQGTTASSAAVAAGTSTYSAPLGGSVAGSNGATRLYGSAASQPSDRTVGAGSISSTPQGATTVLPLGAADPAARPALSSVSIEDVPMTHMFLGLGLAEHDPSAASGNGGEVSQSTVDSFTADLNAAIADAVRARTGGTGSDSDVGTSGWSLTDITSAAADAQVTVTLLNLFFVALELVALSLCFFSLLASMIANISEQTKEIGVLLALGLPAGRLVRVYTHEAFALTVSACVMGTIIGAIVAWTFGQQQALFTSVPAPFTVPWGTIITVVVASGAAALLAACVPARRLTRRNITSLLR